MFQTLELLYAILVRLDSLACLHVYNGGLKIN